MGEMQVQVPDGTPPGGQMQVMTPQGAMLVQVPPDKKPGDLFTFMVPDAPPMGTPVTQPMAQGAVMQPPMAQGAVIQPAMVQPVVAQGAVMQPVAAQPATVVVQQQSFQQPVVYGRHSVRMTCPTHGTPSHTNPVAEPGLGTWLLCLGLCCIGCDLGCCFIPFCVDDAKDIKHHCANCGTVVGEKKLCS
mmetsp:Transcript_23730/g.60362  ORF Transcript_23730/g.60362 Transcript_23730/m.60362 type:complete len:189 (+) Transcript_23730:50-616(+)|eukprot:CAMPEP_0118829732 /NCGR_PEP_ID=MMETSP1162-20130426/24429_1 /TAXON_ID=33656 /ORGANISM="Phaeocystis Sp, Strain CCMP2710" /LENGTH=188 /DNA_ID=CAMNT_0006760949 /DNA_START=50 /DNA_END=616 /DNA_ORIENTATION=+